MARTLPPNKVLLMVNFHFRGTPLEPGWPEFATQVPQGTFSGRLDEPITTVFDEDERRIEEDERGKTFEEDDSTGIIPGRLELLYTGIIPGRLELLYTGIIPGRLELEVEPNGLKLE